MPKIPRDVAIAGTGIAIGCGHEGQIAALKADPDAINERAVASLARACIAHPLGTFDGHPGEHLQRLWAQRR